MGKGGCVISVANKARKLATTDENIRKITFSDLAEKNTVEECWIAYEGYVYDATHWLSKHPGGIRSIMSAAGSDASSVMKSLHTPDTLKTYMRRTRKVGLLVEDSETISVTALESVEDKFKKTTKMAALKRKAAIYKDFSDLNEKLIDEGWYEPKPFAYSATIVRVVSMLVSGISLMSYSQSDNFPSSEYSTMLKIVSLTLGAMLIGFFFQNVAFMGHDAGHGSITGSFSIDSMIGIFIGNVFTGIDMGWWKSSHYVHHSATNSLHDDPDIQHMPLLCLDERMTDGRWSTYHGKFMLLDAVGRMVLPYQHFYFYPVLAVARFNLYVQSILYLLKTAPFCRDQSKATGKSVLCDKTGEVKETYAWPKQKLSMWSASVIGLCIFHTSMIRFYSSLGFYTGIYCYLITHVVAGLLHVQIMASHLSMHYCEDGPGTVGAKSAPNGHNEAGYYEWQALSTMDISCPPWMDWFHGGLQFQLEHHLFPRVPKWNLRKLCVLTDEIFAKYDIPVVRMGFVEANKVMLNHIAEVGQNVAKAKSD
mmetsp:Transcript_13775/g.15486  ORF Transcript_13775/g.15486 Transcript_13775/m.15486 type:complete len:535 (+) Transcript_13775:99-1703(+)